MEVHEDCGVRLLFIDVRAEHLNPTATLLPRMFASLPHAVDFWGPGYTEDATLRGGLRRWVDIHGPYDAIVAGTAIPLLAEDVEAGVAAAASALFRNAVQGSGVKSLETCFRDVLGAFDLLPVRHRIVTTLNFDCYAATSKQIDRIQRGDWMLLGPDDAFTSRLADLPDYARRELHYAKKAARLSDAWLEMLQGRRHRHLAALHFVAPEEICFQPLQKRAQRIAVPGVAYVLRREAIDALRSSGVSNPGLIIPRLIRSAAKLGIPVFRWRRGLDAYHRAFQRTLRRTQVVYTARGGFGLPVRKFFEIPAAGAVMACTPCLGMQHIGFQPGKHYVDLAPDDLPTWLASARNHDEMQALADAGRALVAQSHSLQARAEQVSRCLDRLESGDFAGSRWRNGQFELMERH